MQGAFTNALTRIPGADAEGGLTTCEGAPLDHERLLAQHDAYVRFLRSVEVDVDVDIDVEVDVAVDV